ncbi:hypothetical protein MHU86_8475 [Fragilaria crotonensis]|nr:hypothetical protein MHU86_8475 [Fragilaria crotonensis]
MGLSLSLPMQAMMYGALEKTAVGIFVCGSIAVFLFSNSFVGILRVKPKIVASSTSTAAIKTNYDSGSRSSDMVYSNGTTRAKSLVAGDLPNNNACADPKSLCKGVIPYGDEEMPMMEEFTDDDSPRGLSDAEQLLIWENRTWYGQLPAIDEESVDASFESHYDSESNFGYESRLDKLLAGDRGWFDEQAKMASRDDLLEMGESLYLMGEMLHLTGKRADALQVFERAAVVQKRAMEQVMASLAALLREVGVYHRDRGDHCLSVVLVGVADLLHAKPSPTCLLLCEQVLNGYQRSHSTSPEIEESMKAINENIELIRREAKPLARSLRGQADSYLV